MSENKELILRDVKLRENALMKNVYLWMILGLAVTAGIAFFVSTSEAALRFIFLNPIVTIAIFIAQLVLVMVLSGRVERLSTGAAVGTFLGYSALTGVTLSSIFLAYTGTSIAIAFMSALSVFIGGAIWCYLRCCDEEGSQKLGRLPYNGSFRTYHRITAEHALQIKWP